MKVTRHARRAGTVGQIERQARSHDAPDCGSYRLVANVGPSRWLVDWIAPCDQPGHSELRFVSRDAYDSYF